MFLYIVRWLDLYASGSFRTVVVCFGAGLAAFVLALRISSSLARLVGYALAVVLGCLCKLSNQRPIAAITPMAR